MKFEMLRRGHFVHLKISVVKEMLDNIIARL